MNAGTAWSNPMNLVFTDESGYRLTKSVVYRTYKALVKSIGRPEARFHDLRHSSASFLINAGFNLKEIQEWMGHSDIATTGNIYKEKFGDKFENPQLKAPEYYFNDDHSSFSYGYGSLDDAYNNVVKSLIDQGYTVTEN